MGSSSVSTHSGFVHWQGILLIVSLLNFWSQPTTAEKIDEAINAREGKNVLPHIHHRPIHPAGIIWHRVYTNNRKRTLEFLNVNPRIHKRGPPDGRVTKNHDGSLMLKNVARKHGGIYPLLERLQGCKTMKGCARLNVYPRVSVPTLIASNSTVRANKDTVVFTCYTNTHAIWWFFNGTSLMLTERIKLSRDRKNLTIDPVQREDAGDYHCKAFNPMNNAKSASLTLDVKFE